MPLPEVVVIAESPSLGSSVFDLLLAGGLRVELVKDLGEAVDRYGQTGSNGPRVLVSAPANRHSETARRWPDGPFRNLPLVVVGVRDPVVEASERLHVVTLPLVPERLLELVRRLAG
jgi:hypothetical protein